MYFADTVKFRPRKNQTSTKKIAYRQEEGGYESDNARKVKIEAAFKLLTSGRAELIPHAISLLPTSKVLLLNFHQNLNVPFVGVRALNR